MKSCPDASRATRSDWPDLRFSYTLQESDARLLAGLDCVCEDVVNDTDAFGERGGAGLEDQG